MNESRVCQVSVIVAVCIASTVTLSAATLGTAFTYQGRLKSAGAPVNATADFQFSLWDAAGTGSPPTGGTQIGATQAVSSATVTGGLFTVQLNAGDEFGATAFTGDARWLQIAVRSPAGSGSYTILAPRQSLTATPYALQTRGIFVDSAFRVGMGTLTPGMSLEVSNPSYYGKPALGASDAGAYAYLHVSSTADHSLIWDASRAMRFGTETSRGAGYIERMRVDANGNVGIGTTTPATRLEVVDPSFTALRARNTSATGIAPAIEGFISSGDSFAAGIVGRVLNTTPGDLSAGVVGVTDSSTFRGAGVWGIHFAAGSGVYGSAGAGGYGVFGNSVGVGVNGLGDTGVVGTSNHTGVGGIGVLGVAGTGNIGVRGESSAGGAASIGVVGQSTDSSVSATGVRGIGYYGVHGIGQRSDLSPVGVLGETTNAGGGVGVKGIGGLYGVYGTTAATFTDAAGVYGEATSTTGVGVLGRSGTGAGAVGVFGKADSASALAGRFSGNVSIVGDLTVTGNVFKPGGSFRIDHPLDPANKHLSHSFVESPDMKNVYDGMTVTDANGYAEVILPDWFEALNRDFRYQLTVLDETDGDEFVQAKVVRKIQGNHFTIRTSRPKVEVSWQVTGIRQDAWANAHRIVVEELKPEAERGKFLAPEVEGQPAELGIDYAEHLSAKGGPPI